MTDIITGDRLLLAILNLSFNGTLIILGHIPSAGFYFFI